MYRPMERRWTDLPTILHCVVGNLAALQLEHSRTIILSYVRKQHQRDTLMPRYADA